MKKPIHRLIVFAYFSISTIVALAQAPTITSLSPASGSVGSLITLTGTNLNNPTAFTVGGTTAVVVSNNGSTLVGYIMPGTISGAVSITTTSGTVAANNNFTITPASFPASPQGIKAIEIGAPGLIALSADGNTAVLGRNRAHWNGDSTTSIYTRFEGVWTQQGNNLTGTGAIGAGVQGTSVALSADGNTAIVGGETDNSGVGAAWVFIRSGGIWTQQGGKLIGTDSSSMAAKGSSVALSADGNTAIVGGREDNGGFGAAFIFTRNSGIWSQQGNKLAGKDNISVAEQGISVAISADGNTAIVGGYRDKNGYGAVWVYTRSGGIWTQQGSKLVGTGVIGSANLGYSISLSADGNTALVGGYNDNNNIGAAWVFTRSGGIWTQQGSKLAGINSVGASRQGQAVALSADGNMALVGGYSDANVGAVWVYTRSGGIWTQQGSKLAGTSGSTAGNLIAMSSDATTAMVGANDQSCCNFICTNNTITLSSGAGTDNQALCKNGPIANITYNSTGYAFASLSGLPAGTTGSWANNVETISGTPTTAGTFNFAYTLAGGCAIAKGTIKVSTCMGIGDVTDKEAEIKIFPNPVNGNVAIQISNMNEHAVFYMYNPFGQVVEIVQLNSNEITLQPTGLPSGVYLYRIVKDNQEITTGKLIFNY